MPSSNRIQAGATLLDRPFYLTSHEGMLIPHSCTSIELHRRLHGIIRWRRKKRNANVRDFPDDKFPSERHNPRDLTGGILIDSLQSSSVQKWEEEDAPGKFHRLRLIAISRIDHRGTSPLYRFGSHDELVCWGDRRPRRPSSSSPFIRLEEVDGHHEWAQKFENKS